MPGQPLQYLELRPLEAADLTEVAGWFRNVADLACFERAARLPLSPRGLEQAWSDMTGDSRDTGNSWFAITAETDRLCGIAGLESISPVNRDAVIAIFIEESSRRQGLGIRSMALLLDFAFRQIGLNRVTSYYRADNTRSRKLTAQAGFTIEGRMREAWYAEGRYFDMVAVGVLRAEWEACRKGLAQKLDAPPRAGFPGADSSGWVWPPGPEDPAAE
ncbi:MAG: GNAT family N-acetyltransferase [Leisingera sp.]